MKNRCFHMYFVHISPKKHSINFDLRCVVHTIGRKFLSFSYFLTIGNTMPQVKIREKNQITLPISIVKAAHLHPNDTLEAEYENGVIRLVITPQPTKKKSLMSYAGSLDGLYGKNDNEVTTYIHNERESWER